MRLSIVTKIWLGFLLVFIAILLCLGGFLSWYLSSMNYKHQVGELVNHGRNWADLVSANTDPKITQAMTLFDKLLSYDFAMVDLEGHVLFTTAPKHMPQGSVLKYPELNDAVNGNVTTSEIATPDQGKMVVVLVPYEQNGRIAGILVIHSPKELMEKTSDSIQEAILVGIALAVAISSLLALLVSKRLSKPLLKMNKIALGMISGNFSERVNVAEPMDEIGILGTTLNKLSEKLDESINVLEGQREELSNIIESMTDGIASFDIKGAVILENIKGIPVCKSVHGNVNTVNDFGTEIQGLFNDVISENRASQITSTYENRAILIKMSPLHSTGVTKGVVALFQDVTREYQVEQMRREFIAVVSHELRSPLGLIQGYTEAVRDGLASDYETQDQYYSIILDETERLKRLVNDLLDLSSLEAKNGINRAEITNLKSILIRVCDHYEPVTKSAGVELKLKTTDIAVLGEEDRLEQVIVNLLDNAIRFTPCGGQIIVEATVQGDSVQVYITDNGIGIEPADLPHIWNKFYKADKARTLGKGGTGLGLSIVRSIIQAHGGQVFVTSCPGKGSRFGFKLPLPACTLELP